MKNLLFILLIPVILLAVGCNQKNEEIARLKATNDSLRLIGFVKDSTVIDFVNVFNGIQANLDSIKIKEKIISKTINANSEIKSLSKEQINSDINMIYRLQLENKALVESLRIKLKKSNVHAVQLEEMVNNLTNQIEEKDFQIVQLKDNLAKANIQVTDLTTRVIDQNASITDLSTANTKQQQIIDEKTTELNTAYFIVGTNAYLKEKNIITKEGGFIGLGRSKELTPEMNKNNFTKVDITQLKAIPLMKSKVSIITSHPKSSYRLTGKNQSDSLIIINQKDFWSLSKVLVINVK